MRRTLRLLHEPQKSAFWTSVMKSKADILKVVVLNIVTCYWSKINSLSGQVAFFI